MSAAGLKQTEREQKIEANLKLVHACAHRMEGRGIAYEELYAAGCVGLIKAVDGFDETRGFAFSTYAVPVILGEIKRLFRDGGAVKVGRTLKERSLKVTQTQAALQTRLGRDPTVGEIAAELSLSPEETAEALSAALPTVSLTYEDEDGERELALSDGGMEEALISRLALHEVLDALPEHDRALIELRYYKEKTQMETARALGMTQVQVSRRERAILTQLRQMLG